MNVVVEGIYEKGIVKLKTEVEAPVIVLLAAYLCAR